MLYALLGSLVINGLTVLFLLWRKSIVEGELVSAQKSLVIKSNESEGWKSSYDLLKKSSDDQAARAEQQIKTLETQNDTMLKELEKAGTSGVFAELLQKRNSSSVPGTP